MQKSLNLTSPEAFNEKIQWLKIYDKNPRYTKLVDKIEVKKFVASMIGERYIIPTLATYDKFDDIDFNILPNQFVLKSSHDSGGIVICKCKQNFNCKKAKRVIMKSLNKNYFYYGREWPYKNVKPRILVESYMEDSTTKALNDYKFFCFDGEPKLLLIVTERQNENCETKFDFFDMDFKRLDIKNGFPNSVCEIVIPKKFFKMIEIARKLSSGLLHVRVDLYEVDGEILSHFSGLVPFEPFEWDVKMGM